MSGMRTRDLQFLERLHQVIIELMSRGGIDIKTMAAEFIMSPSQFSRRVKALTGITPAAYILSVRLAEAKRLMTQPDPPPLIEIALHCGFADNSHFSHVFRRIEGISPTAYMRSHTSYLI